MQAVARQVEVEPAPPRRLGRRVEHQPVRRAGRAEAHLRRPGPQRRALGFPERVHERGANVVSVAVPALDDPIIPLAGKVLFHHGVQRGFQARVRDAIEQHQRAFDAVGVRVRAPLTAAAGLVEQVVGIPRHAIHGFRHGVPEPRLAGEQRSRVDRIVEIPPTVHVPRVDGLEGEDIDAHHPHFVGVAPGFEQAVDHAQKRLAVGLGAFRLAVLHQQVSLRQATHDFVAVVGEAERRVQRLGGGDIPGVRRQKVGGGQHVQEVEIREGGDLLDVSRVARPPRQAGQGLQQVAVDLCGLRRDAPAPGPVGRLFHHGRSQAAHAMIPGRLAEQLGDRDQAVFHVLARAKHDLVEVEFGLHEALAARQHVAGQTAGPGAVDHLLPQQIAQTALMQFRVGEPALQHEKRVEVGRRVLDHPVGVREHPRQQARHGIGPF